MREPWDKAASSEVLPSASMGEPWDKAASSEVLPSALMGEPQDEAASSEVLPSASMREPWDKAACCGSVAMVLRCVTDEILFIFKLNLALKEIEGEAE